MSISSKTVGILALQGCVDPHIRHLEKIGVSTLLVRDKNDLSLVDGIILPGGESSTILKLLKKGELFNELKSYVQTHPVWGICAGAILLSQKVLNPSQESLKGLPLQATRNYYGSQLDSFKAQLDISALLSSAASEPLLDVDFIRAPLLTPLALSLEGQSSYELISLASHNEHGVLYRYGNMLASSFHTELGDDSRMHRYFVDMIL